MTHTQAIGYIWCAWREFRAAIEVALTKGEVWYRERGLDYKITREAG